MFFKPQHLHFTGIGGIGMSGIAEVLLNLGYTVSGSDLKLSPITERLVRLGATVYEGHAAENVAGARALVVSSAVDEKNPEVREARRLQIPVIPRGELLAELMRLKYGIAVAGSHGKTTTTSIIAAIFNGLGLDPTVVVGGRSSAMGGSNARVGKSEYLVVESDESDRSFLKLAPILAIVTNIDREHLDCYSSLDDIRNSFTEFINRVPFYGAAILCLDDDNIRGILPSVKRRAVTYGTSPQADFEVSEIVCEQRSSGFRVRVRGADLGRFCLHVPGKHNVLNATAAIAVAIELDQKPDAIREALATFAGVDRRFQIRGVERGVTVVDDYGHHPTEIRATLSSARLGGYRRILVLFQPHRYTRTNFLMDEFAGAFHQSDRLFLMDIYAASEQPIEGVTAEALAQKTRASGHKSVEYVGSMDKGIDAIVEDAREGDLVLTLGAGSVSQAGPRILEALRGKVIVAKEAKKTGFNWRLWLRIGFWTIVLATTMMAARALNQFAHTDPHFTLDQDAGVAANSTDLTITGLRFASRARVLRVFANDFGANIFDIPIDERRRKLLAVDWVEHASVSRIWPNRLIVRIWERQPVAFVNLTPQGGRTTRLALIDAYGVILDRPERLDFSSPILSGVHENQSERERQERVRHYTRLMSELGPLAKKLSGVDVSKPENLKVDLELEGRSVELLMGDRNFSRRLQDFLDHYSEIHKRSGTAATFDLRLDDRITTRE